MRAPVVLELDPVGDHPTGMRQALEPMPMHALLLQHPDQPLHRAVLLRAMRRDELLAQTVATHQSRIGPAGKAKPLSERTRNGLATGARLPNRAIKACSSAAAAVIAFPLHDNCRPNSSRVWQSITNARTSHPGPPIPGTGRSTSVRSRTALLKATLGSSAEADQALAHLPALQLEDPLHHVLVHRQQSRHRAIAERRLDFDQRLDRLRQVASHLRRPVAHRRRLPEPSALLQDAVRQQSLLDRDNQVSSLPKRDANFFGCATSASLRRRLSAGP